MSTLRIREYTQLADVAPGGKAMVAQESGTVIDNSATFTGTAGSSTAFGTNTKYIGMIADVAFAYSVGKTPTATTAMIGVGAGELIYIGVAPGDKISAIAT
jgi:hypothetical protein